MPSCRIVFPLAIALALAGPAFGQATYRLAVAGDIDHTVNCWETVPLCSGPPHVHTPWAGTLTITVDSAADGFYQGPDLESLSFVSDIGGFTASPFAGDPAFDVTITGGHVSSVDALEPVTTPLDTSAFTIFIGLVAGYDATGGTHYGPTIASGTLSPISEPGDTTLLLAGLAALAALRRRQARASGQRGLTSNA